MPQDSDTRLVQPVLRARARVAGGRLPLHSPPLRSGAGHDDQLLTVSSQCLRRGCLLSLAPIGTRLADKLLASETVEPGCSNVLAVPARYRVDDVPPAHRPPAAPLAEDDELRLGVRRRAGPRAPLRCWTARAGALLLPRRAAATREFGDDRGQLAVSPQRSQSQIGNADSGSSSIFTHTADPSLLAAGSRETGQRQLRHLPALLLLEPVHDVTWL
mmetsp:Transcript_29338/g.92610  ORF Transcript_29338/g.92610 Transcript_29338/m.92610 type:complete len:216 (+) Transcript_29338:278-925(+)